MIRVTPPQPRTFTRPACPVFKAWDSRKTLGAPQPTLIRLAQPLAGAERGRFSLTNQGVPLAEIIHTTPDRFTVLFDYLPRSRGWGDEETLRGDELCAFFSALCSTNCSLMSALAQAQDFSMMDEMGGF